MNSPFPKLIVDPDSHPCDVFCEDRVVASIADLHGDVPPRIHLNGEVVDRSQLNEGGPEVDEAPLLLGRLWSGHDLILADCRAEAFFPGRCLVLPRYALVGLNARHVADQAYEELVVQATGLDLLFGRPPLKSVRWPHDQARYLDGEFAATGEPDSTQEWDEPHAKVTCSYWSQQSSVDNPYRFELRFAPVVSVKADHGRRIDEWLAGYVNPLVSLLTLATRKPQTISWVRFRHPPKTVEGGRRQWPVDAQLFGSGISQTPYVSEDAAEWRRSETRPIFNLASSGLPLPEMLRAWRGLEDGENPFVELYRLAMFQRDLPQRAQFLYLVQALEALHSYEHRRKDTADAATYKRRRDETITRLVTAGVEADDLKFLKSAWSSRPRDDLARRLRSLVRHTGLPTKSRQVVDGLSATDIYAELRERNVESAIRRIRNDLAHGNRNYADRGLRPWTEVLDALCRAHLLRLLSCPPSVMEAAFSLPER